MARLDDFRREKDHAFRHDPQSPLPANLRGRFQGLAYYPPNPALRLEAELDPAVEPGEVRMATTGGGEQVYRRHGIVHFEVDGQAAQVVLYKAAETDELFLPFRDATSGKETYGAGRYLEVEPARQGRVVVDFNYAYSPFCAYNPAYSCPLPPVENWLRVPIRAGEKAFPAH